MMGVLSLFFLNLVNTPEYWYQMLQKRQPVQKRRPCDKARPESMFSKSNLNSKISCKIRIFLQMEKTTAGAARGIYKSKRTTMLQTRLCLLRMMLRDAWDHIAIEPRSWTGYVKMLRLETAVSFSYELNTLKGTAIQETTQLITL